MFPVALLGRAVPVLHTDEGLRAVGKDQKPVTPESVEKYLKSKYGESLPQVRAAMVKLAKSRAAEDWRTRRFGCTSSSGPGFRRASRDGGRKGR